MKKIQLIRLISQQLEASMQELTVARNFYQVAADIDEGDTIEPEDLSTPEANYELSLQMQRQLEEIRSEQAMLIELSQVQTEVVKPGALVETDMFLFYVGVSFPAVEAGFKELIGISTASPMYEQMKHKRKGDHFEVDGLTFNILQVS